jgi:hypothetical protein
VRGFFYYVEGGWEGVFFCFNFRMLKRDGSGVEVYVFFCFHLTCGRRKGKG